MLPRALWFTRARSTFFFSILFRMVGGHLPNRIIAFNDLMVNMIRKHFLYRQLVLSFFLFCPRLLAVIRAITSPYGNLIITCEYNR